MYMFLSGVVATTTVSSFFYLYLLSQLKTTPTQDSPPLTENSMFSRQRSYDDFVRHSENSSIYP